MTERTKQLVIVRGGGDIATGTIHKLCRCGYPVLVLESGYPSAIRRCVAFSEAVYDGTSEVEGITCIKASCYDEACTIMEQGAVPVMIDENCGVLEKCGPGRWWMPSWQRKTWVPQEIWRIRPLDWGRASQPDRMWTL